MHKPLYEIERPGIRTFGRPFYLVMEMNDRIDYYIIDYDYFALRFILQKYYGLSLKSTYILQLF